jgi:hypothetical protein
MFAIFAIFRKRSGKLLNNPIARIEPELPLRRRLHRSADRLVALLSDLR